MADFDFHVLSTCGRKEMVVQLAASNPITVTGEISIDKGKDDLGWTLKIGRHQSISIARYFDIRIIRYSRFALFDKERSAVRSCNLLSGLCRAKATPLLFGMGVT
ncbi:hypothetical protein [Cyclonatronum proteinivorum]|uniref:hypothetical protein n=1 Tax=Cyclonatronum proteinivorum TaxID=1457365 RepID=UPI0013E0CDEE|nr:hypothetical protein [Cyclonatronum proteinivorum]